VYHVILYSNSFDDPRIADRLIASAQPEMAFVEREGGMSTMLFTDQVIGGLPPDPLPAWTPPVEDADKVEPLTPSQ
jgi:hypothetical protein